MKTLCLIDGQPLLWLLSVSLLFIGGLVAFGNTLSMLALGVDALRGGFRSTSFVLGLPAVGGLLLLLGVLLLPTGLPFNRVLFASLAACLDLSLLVVIAMLIFLPFRKRRS